MVAATPDRGNDPPRAALTAPGTPLSAPVRRAGTGGPVVVRPVGHTVRRGRAVARGGADDEDVPAAMSYGRTTYRSRRRMRVRTPITLLLLLGLVIAAGWYGLRQVRAPTPRSTATATACVPVPVKHPRPNQRVASASVVVNVYNAGNISGLAEQTAAALKLRGFGIGTIGNDPAGSNFTGYLLVRGAAPNLPSVKLLMQQATGAVFRKVNRSDASVDAVLGAKFRSLAPNSARSVPFVTSEATFPAGCGTG